MDMLARACRFVVVASALALGACANVAPRADARGNVVASATASLHGAHPHVNDSRADEEHALLVPEHSVDVPHAKADGDWSTPVDAAPDDGSFTGRVSWYGKRFAGRRTANGERFDPKAYTMAHRELPFGTRVRVTNPANGRSVVVRVNDRGPYVGVRVADLSHAAARRLGMVADGVIVAHFEVLDDDEAASGGPTELASSR
jgi:rare lipoprotein A (peptidoglycan hydrolase)